LERPTRLAFGVGSVSEALDHLVLQQFHTTERKPAYNAYTLLISCHENHVQAPNKSECCCPASMTRTAASVAATQKDNKRASAPMKSSPRVTEVIYAFVDSDALSDISPPGGE